MKQCSTFQTPSGFPLNYRLSSMFSDTKMSCPSSAALTRGSAAPGEGSCLSSTFLARFIYPRDACIEGSPQVFIS